jgi:hypothetical protein
MSPEVVHIDAGQTIVILNLLIAPLQMVSMPAHVQNLGF